MKPLPDNILKRLSAADRKSLGRAGMTQEEALAKMEIKKEGQLQNQIVALLRLRGIEPIYQQFGKKTRTKAGTPDILFAVEDPNVGGDAIAFAWELKMERTGIESKEQIAMRKKLSTRPNCWRCFVITSLDQAREILTTQAHV